MIKSIVRSVGLAKPTLERVQVTRRETAEELRRNAEQEKVAATAKP